MADVNVNAREAFFTMPDLEGDIGAQQFSITADFWPAQVFLSRTDELDQIFFLCDDTEGLEIELYTAEVTGSGSDQTFTPDTLLLSASHAEGGESPFQDVDVGNQSNTGAVWRRLKLDTAISVGEGSFHILVFKTTSTSKSPTVFWSAEYRQSLNPIIIASTDSGFTWSNDNIETITAGNMQAGAIIMGYIGKEVDTSNFLDSGDNTIGGTSSARRGYPVFLFVENLTPLETTISLNFAQIPPSDPINGTSEETDQAMMEWYFLEEGVLPLTGDLETIIFKTNAQPQLDINAEFVMFFQPDRLSHLADPFYPETALNTYAEPVGVVPIYSSSPSFIDFETPASDENINTSGLTDVSDRFDTLHWGHFRNKADRVEVSGDRDAETSQNPSYVDFSTEKPGKEVELLKSIELGASLAGGESEEDVVRGFNQSAFFNGNYILFSKKTTDTISAIGDITVTPGELTAYISDDGLTNWQRRIIRFTDSSPSTIGTIAGSKSYIVGVQDSIVVPIEGVDTLFLLFQTISFGSESHSQFDIGYYQGDLSGNIIDVQLISHESSFTTSPSLEANLGTIPDNDPDAQVARFIFPNNSDSLYFTVQYPASTEVESGGFLLVGGLSIWKVGLNDTLSSSYEAERLKINSTPDQRGISDQSDMGISFVLNDGITTYLGVKTNLFFRWLASDVEPVSVGHIARIYRTDDFQTFEQLVGGKVFDADDSSQESLPNWMTGFFTLDDFAPEGDASGSWPEDQEKTPPMNDVKFMHKVGDILHVWIDTAFFTNNNKPIHLAIDTITKEVRLLRVFPIEDEGDSSYGVVPKISDLDKFPRSKALRHIEGGSVNGNHIYIYGAESLASAEEPASSDDTSGSLEDISEEENRGTRTEFKTRWLMYDDRIINKAFDQYNNSDFFVANTSPGTGQLSSVAFTGSGTNDLSTNGIYTGTSFDEQFLVQIVTESLDPVFTAGAGIGNGPLDDLIATGSTASPLTFDVEIDRVGMFEEFTGTGTDDLTLSGTPTTTDGIRVEISKEAASEIFTGTGTDDLIASITGSPPASQVDFEVEIDCAGLNPSFTPGSGSSTNLDDLNISGSGVAGKFEYTVTISELAGTVNWNGLGLNSLPSSNITISSPEEAYTYQICIDKIAYDPVFNGVGLDDFTVFGDSLEGFLYEVEIDTKAMRPEANSGNSDASDFQLNYEVAFNGTGTDNFEIDLDLTEPNVIADFVIEIDSIGPSTFQWSMDGGSTFVATGVSAGTGLVLGSTGVVVDLPSSAGHVVGDQWAFQTGANAAANYRVEIDSIGLDPVPDSGNSGVDDLTASTSGGGPLEQIKYVVDIDSDSGRFVDASTDVINGSSGGADDVFDEESDTFIKALGNVPDDRTSPETDPPYSSTVRSFRAEIDSVALRNEESARYFYTVRDLGPAATTFAIEDVVDETTVGSLGSLKNDPTDLKIQKDYAYLVAGSSSSDFRLEIIDVSDKTSPTLVGSLDFNDAVDLEQMDILDETLIIGGTVSSPLGTGTNSTAIPKITVVDVGDPENPTIRGVTDAGGSSDPRQIKIVKRESKNLAYVSSLFGDNVGIIDVTDKDDPLYINSSNSPCDGPTGIDVFEDYAYLTCRNDGTFVIFDITTVNNELPVTSGTASLFPAGTFIEGATSGATATVIGQSSPDTLLLGNATENVGGASFDSGGETINSATASTSSTAGLTINRPSLIRTVSSTSGGFVDFIKTFELELSSGDINTYVAIGTTGTDSVEIFDVTETLSSGGSTAPTSVAFLDSTTTPAISSGILSLDVVGNKLYLQTSTTEVEIFEISIASLEFGYSNVIQPFNDITITTSTFGRISNTPLKTQNENQTTASFKRTSGDVSFEGSSTDDMGLQVSSKDVLLTVINQLGSLSIGETITGSITGATALIIDITGGLLDLGDFNGRFEDGETVSNGSGWSATVSSSDYDSSNEPPVDSGKYVIRTKTDVSKYEISTDGGASFTGDFAFSSATSAFVDSFGTNVLLKFSDSFGTPVAGDCWKFDVGPVGVFNYKIEIDGSWTDTLDSSGVVGLDDLSLFGKPTLNSDYRVVINQTADQFGYGYGQGEGLDFFNVFNINATNYGYGYGTFEQDYALSYSYGLGFEYGTGFDASTEGAVDPVDTFDWYKNGLLMASSIPITGEPQELDDDVFVHFGSKGKFTETYIYIDDALGNLHTIKQDAIGNLNETDITVSPGTPLASAIASANDVLFLASLFGNNLLVYDIINKEKPVFVEEIAFTEGPVSMDVDENNHLYISFSAATDVFRIYDITNIRYDRIGFLDSAAGISTAGVIKYHKDHVFWFTGASTDILQSWDVSSPTALPGSPEDSLTASFTITGSFSELADIDKERDVLFISNSAFPTDIQSIDISDPTALASLGTFSSEITILGIKVIKNLLLVAGHEDPGLSGLNEKVLQIWEVSDATSITKIGEFRLPVLDDDVFSNIRAKDGFAYVLQRSDSSSRESKIIVFDISSTNNIKIVKEITLAGSSAAFTTEFVDKVSSQGHLPGDEWTFNSSDTFRWTDQAENAVIVWKEEGVSITGGRQQIDNNLTVDWNTLSSDPIVGGYAVGDSWDTKTVKTFRWESNVGGDQIDPDPNTFTWSNNRVCVPYEGGRVDLVDNVYLQFTDSAGSLDIGDYIDWYFTLEDTFNVEAFEFDPLNPDDTSVSLGTPVSGASISAGASVDISLSTPGDSVDSGPVFIEFVNETGHVSGDSFVLTTLDTFRWTDKSKSIIGEDPSGFSITWNATKIPIDDDVLDIYALNNNVDIKFNKKNNHVIGDLWDFSTVDTFKYSVGNSSSEINTIRECVFISLGGGTKNIGKIDDIVNPDSLNDVFINFVSEIGHTVGDKWTFTTTDAFKYKPFGFGYGYGYGIGADYFDVFGVPGGLIGYGWDVSSEIGTDNQNFESVNAFAYGFGTGYEYSFGQYGFSTDVDVNCVPIKTGTNTLEAGVILDFSNLTGHSGSEVWDFSSGDKFTYTIDSNPTVGPLVVNDENMDIENGISVSFDMLTGFTIGDTWTFKTIDTFKYSKNTVEIATGVEITGGLQGLGDGLSILFGSVAGHTEGDSWNFSALDEFDVEIIGLSDGDDVFGGSFFTGTPTTSGIAITGSAQSIGSTGTSVTFGSQTGHTDGNTWDYVTVDSFKYNTGGSDTDFIITTTTPKTLVSTLAVQFSDTLNHNVGDNWVFSSTDTMKYSSDGGATFSSETAIPSGATSIGTGGTTFTFSSTTGHISGDIWEFHPMTRAGFPLVSGKGVYHGKTIVPFEHDETSNIYNDYPSLSPDIDSLTDNPRVGMYCSLINYAGSPPDNIENDGANLPNAVISGNGITYLVSDNDDHGIRAFKTYGIKELPENWGRSFKEADKTTSADINNYEFIDLDLASLETSIGGPSTFQNVARRAETTKTNDILFVTEMKQNDSGSGDFDGVDSGFPNRSVLAFVNGQRKPQEISMFFKMNYLGDIENDEIGGVPVSDILGNVDTSDTVINIKCAQTIEKLFFDPQLTLQIPLAQDVTTDESQRSLIRNVFPTDTENNFFRIESNNILSDGASPPVESVDLRVKALRLHDISLSGPEEESNNMKAAMTGIVAEGSGVPENVLENGADLSPNGEVIVDFAKAIYMSEISFDIEYFGGDLAGANQSQFEIYVLPKSCQGVFGQNIVDEVDWVLLGSPEFVSLTGNKDSIKKDAIGMFIKAVRIVLKSGVTLRVSNLTFKSFSGSSDQFQSSGDVNSPEMIVIDDINGLLAVDTSNIASSFSTLNESDSYILVDLEENVPTVRLSLNVFSGGPPTRTLEVDTWDGVTIDGSGDPEFENLYTRTVEDYELSVVQWTPRTKDKSREVQVNFLDNDDLEGETSISDTMRDFNKPENAALLENSGLAGFSFRPNSLKDGSITVSSSENTPEGDFNGSIFVNVQMDEDGPFASDIDDSVLGLIEKNINIDFPMRQVRQIRITLKNQSGSDPNVRLNGLKVFSPLVDEDGMAEFPRSGVTWTIRLTASILTQ